MAGIISWRVLLQAHNLAQHKKKECVFEMPV